MNRLGFTLFRNNYWYKLENQLIHRFGFFQGIIDFDISPMFFAFLPGEHSSYWHSLISDDARRESIDRFFNYKRGMEDPSEYSGFLLDLYNTYIKSNLESCNNVDSALDLTIMRLDKRFPSNSYENRILTCGYVTVLPKPSISITGNPDIHRLYIYRKQYSLLESILLKLVIEYYEHRLNELLSSIRALKEPDAPSWHADVVKITEDILLSRYFDYDIYKELLFQLERRDEKALQKYLDDEIIRTTHKIHDFWPSKYKFPDWAN